jgi:hypothetical protein
VPGACYPLIGSALADLIELLNIPAIRGPRLTLGAARHVSR